MTLQDLASVAWKRRWVIAATFVTTVVLAAALALLRPPSYQATATIALSPAVNENQVYLTADNLSALLGTYAETAESEVIRRRASQILGHALPGEVRASTEEGTGILRIQGTAGSPKAAVETADATSRAFVQSLGDRDLLEATVVDPPDPDGVPVEPRPALIIGVAALLGLAGGLLLALAMDRLRMRIHNEQDVAEVTDTPVIGRLPRQRELARGSAQIVWHMPDAVGIQEGIRALRTNIEFLTDGGRPTIQVTSSLAGHGKSTLVANLGIALAQLGIETVIVDADLRKPQQHLIFGVENKRGLSTLMGNPRADGTPQATAYPRLSVLTSGPVPPNATEMLHVRFGPTLARLREGGSLLLIDSPPLLPVSDARLIAQHVDGVILVSAAGMEKPATMRSALEKLAMSESRLLGIVLNRVGEDAEEFGGYYYYGRAHAQGNGARATRAPTATR